MRACLLSTLLLLPQDPSPEAEPSKAKFKVAHGLAVELFAAEPHFVNPVAFDLDARGRAYVVETHRLGNATFDVRGRMSWVDDDLACRTVADREAMHRKHMGDAAYSKLRASERVRRVEDTDGDGRADRATTFAEGFDTPADGLASGVLVRGKDVWLANVPNLWHLRDEDDDGRADARKVLHHGYGVRLAFIGHDLHGLTWGPDGKLYFTIGDRGLHVEHEGRTVSNPDSGAVLRCNPDGTQLVLFCTGLRNPQELAFDDHGNLWTVDNNCDNGDRARLTLLMEGGDVGWRIGYQQAPRAGPWIAEHLWKPSAAQTAPSQLPAIANIGHGPSGLAFHPGVAGLPPELDGHFFLSNFPGSVVVWRVVEKGAGFEAVGVRELVQNIWSTDVTFGPDGGLYVLDWVDGWGMPNKGRIWRMRDPKVAPPALAELQALLAEDLTRRSDDALVELLGHRDRRVRQSAQFALAARGAGAAFLKAAAKGR
ncbi:MAG TPA: PVC-type heme-binding CxxCH protein, partial [Planctomycetota bacterium]|nr:PVC-type heme-binding CxxCH protein [Planctomycetota bacterium]